MERVVAALTVLVGVMPAVVASLWWTGLLAQGWRRVPQLDSWETTLSTRRAALAALAVANIAGWAAIGYTWMQFVQGQLDRWGYRALADWAWNTLLRG